MMKFASFETVVEMIYNALPGHKNDYSKGAQTGVAFTGGYIAGILCAVVSHPADVMVSKLNANRAPGEAFRAAMGRIYKDIGFMGLWNGLAVRIVMIGTLTGLQWMMYVPRSIQSIRSTDHGDLQLRFFQDLHGSPNYWRSCSGEEDLLIFPVRQRVYEFQLVLRVAVMFWGDVELIPRWIRLFVCVIVRLVVVRTVLSAIIAPVVLHIRPSSWDRRNNGQACNLGISQESQSEQVLSYRHSRPTSQIGS